MGASNSLDPDPDGLDQLSVRPDLGSNYLQVLPAVAASKERVKGHKEDWSKLFKITPAISL